MPQSKYLKEVSYLYLPFVMSEHWSKIAWCCVCAPRCQHVTVLVGCQRCQRDTGCTSGILNSLLNIQCYQWQASTGENAFNGHRDTSQRNSQTGDTGSAAGGFWACCHFLVLSVCTDFLSEAEAIATTPTYSRWCVKNVQISRHKKIKMFLD